MNRLVADLRRALNDASAATAGSRGRRRRRNRRANAPPAPPAVPAVMPPTQPRRRGRTRRRQTAPSLASEGVLRLTKHELFHTVVVGTDGTCHGSAAIHPDRIPFLKTLFRIFERVRWHDVRFCYKPAVGTTQGGLVTYGIDWDCTTAAATRATIACYSPSATNAIWADTTNRPMVLPQSRLNSRLWYTPYAGGNDIEKTPGYFVYAGEGPANTSVGEFWVTYTVTCMGTRPE